MQTRAQPLQEGLARVDVLQKAISTASKQKASQNMGPTQLQQNKKQQQQQQQEERQEGATHSSLPRTRVYRRASIPQARTSLAVTGQRWMRWKQVAQVLQ